MCFYHLISTLCSRILLIIVWSCVLFRISSVIFRFDLFSFEQLIFILI